MATKLEEIISHTRLQLAGSNAFAAMKDLEAEAAHHKPRGFRANLQRVSKAGVAVIAELKKASPSKGLIRADFPVAELAAELEEAGAAASFCAYRRQVFFRARCATWRLPPSRRRFPACAKTSSSKSFNCWKLGPTVPMRYC